MKWITLSEGETGMNYELVKCARCGAPFMESELNDITFSPDLADDETQKEIVWLKEEYKIDLQPDTTCVCRTCQLAVDRLLEQKG